MLCTDRLSYYYCHLLLSNFRADEIHKHFVFVSFATRIYETVFIVRSTNHISLFKSILDNTLTNHRKINVCVSGQN